MFIERKNHPITFIFIIFLLTVFILSGVLIISFGSSIYGETVSQMNYNSDYRICQSYISSKVRQYDSSDMINITYINSIPVLTLSSIIDDSEYVTYLYEYDGFLCEYFTYADLMFNLEDGTKIIKMTNLSFSISNNLLTIGFNDESNLFHTMYIFLHSQFRLHP